VEADSDVTYLIKLPIALVPDVQRMYCCELAKIDCLHVIVHCVFGFGPTCIRRHSNVRANLTQTYLQFIRTVEHLRGRRPDDEDSDPKI
jgi:hypothetical protein